MRGKPSGQGGRSGGGKSSGGARGGERSAKPRSAAGSRHEHVRPHSQAPRHEGGRPVKPPRDNARWVVGLHSCAETLKVRPKAVRELWLRDDYESSQQLRELAEQAQRSRVQLKTRSPGQLDGVGSGHQGVALAVTETPVLDWSIFEGEGRKLVLLLDGIEDPHNLGSILRTAWLSGVAAIFVPEDRAVHLTPAVCKVASGGAEHVPLEIVTNLASEMQRLKDLGFWLYGLSEKGERRPWEFQLPEKTAWVLGNEGSGLRITTERACDELVRIPQVETGSSYNAAIALSMALAETARQFGFPS